MLEFLKTKTMLSVIVGTISQIAVRYGMEFDNNTIEDAVLNIINLATVVGVAIGRWKAKKTFTQPVETNGQ